MVQLLRYIKKISAGFTPEENVRSALTTVRQNFCDKVVPSSW